MKCFYAILGLLLFLSCKNDKNTTTTSSLSASQELQELYDQDQADRKTPEIDWSVVSKNDKKREKRVHELLDQGKVVTAKDYHNAAMIFQHGGTPAQSAMAVKLMKKAIELDPSANKWLLAAAIDRDLMYNDLPQIYGTQYTKDDNDQWVRYNIDTTKITDAERREYHVETLAEQKLKEIRMNKKKLYDFFKSESSVNTFLTQLKKEIKHISSSKYDISESSINQLGYQLISEKNLEDALSILEFNTTAYPEGYNTWDSLGECLMLLKQKEKSIAAYEKSIELNPNNTGAIEKINEMKGE